MSDKTDFTRAYILWRDALRYPDDSPEAFEEVQRLARVDRRVQYLLGVGGVNSWQETVEILNGDVDADVTEWHDSLVSGSPEIVVTEEDIEDVPLD